MVGSLGCPYTCSFCIDAAVPYQPMDFDVLREDLSFLRNQFRRPLVAWHDPNFGVRFDEYLDMIEEAVPPGSIDFAAESSLSLLSEPHLKRLRRNGFKALLPGIESWFELGGKSKTGALQGIHKVRHVSEHVNLILLGPAMTASAPCLAGALSISFIVLFTVWVTPENQLAELALRGSSVLTQDFRGPQMGWVMQSGDSAQRRA